MRGSVLFGFVACLQALVAPAQSADTQRRPLSVNDLAAFRTVSNPQISPDGQWVSYTVQTSDLAKDERPTDLWMTRWDGRQTVQLTRTPDSEHSQTWSPDGRYVSFLASRGEKDQAEQLWLLDRLGGEARQLTQFKGDVADYDWSPDGKQLVLQVWDDPATDPGDDDKDKTAPPIVIDRFYFKEDETGYLDSRRQHLYLLDVASGKSELLTPGTFDEGYPSWSPDGSQIAFVSKRAKDPDRDNVFGLYVMAPKANATPRRLMTFVGESGDSGWMSGPRWSPNGRDIALIAATDAKLIYYAQHRVMIVPAAGGTTQVISAMLDRDVIEPRWSDDGKSIYALVEEDRNQHLSRIDVATGKVQRLLDGRRETTDFDVGPKGVFAIIDSTVDVPEEVFALDRGKSRRLSRQNDEWLSGVQLGAVEETSFTSKDGARISGFLVKPPGFTSGKRYPTLLQIHGGPVSQYANSFALNWQILAAQGYVIVAANPRGSSGRGEAFAKAIWADWGNKDSEDVLAAVDDAVQSGIADPERLGVGGWSYGGILTDFVIAKDKRFKAAVSGASIANALSGYGTDMYTREYEAELGVPWRNLDTYLRISYPFLNAHLISTPTLFMCGEKDFNVPLLNSEQMYQALKSLNVDTQLIIYPGQFHGIAKPSYLKDRLERWIAWYGKYLRTS